MQIDADELRAKVIDVRARYNQIQLKQIATLFEDIAVLPHVAFLHSLRTSELFIQLWRSVGRTVCLQSVDESQNGEFRDFLAMFSNLANDGY